MAIKHFLGGRIVLGTEYAGYKIGIFEAGTSTAKTTYKDSALTVGNENTHPVTLDANGAAQIWFNGNAKAIFYTSADVVVYTDDNINLESSSSSNGAYNAALNGSFEDDTDGDGVPDSWTRTLYSGGAFTVDTTTQSHGDTSAKFTSTGTGGGYLNSTSSFPVKPSEPYELSWDMKSSVADVRNVVQISWYKADGTASATASDTALDDSTTNQTSWARETYNTTAPADAYFAQIRLIGCHSSDATAGSTWFDNVEFLSRKRYGAVEFAGLVAGKINISTNLSLAASVGSNALTIAVKGGDGNDPSTSNPVYVPFRNATATTGDTSWLPITAATSLVISSGSTLGTTSAQAARIWIVGFNDGGTFRLGAINCSTSTNIYSLSDSALASSTAEGGAGAADSAGVIYTGTAVTSKAMRVLGYIEITEATAGTWATDKTKVQLWTSGMKLPGDIVQVAFNRTGAVATGTTTTPNDDTIPQNTEGDQYLSQSITPTSTINHLVIDSQAQYVNDSGSSTYATMALFQDSTADALAANAFQWTVGSKTALISLRHSMLAGTTSGTTLKLRIGCDAAGTGTFNGASAGRKYGGVSNSFMRLTELMG